MTGSISILPLLECSYSEIEREIEKERVTDNRGIFCHLGVDCNNFSFESICKCILARLTEIFEGKVIRDAKGFSNLDK